MLKLISLPRVVSPVSRLMKVKAQLHTGADCIRGREKLRERGIGGRRWEEGR
jgi:hypothetical protein